MTDFLINRRRFVGSVALAGAALSLPGIQVAEARAANPDDWDHSWLKKLDAKHRAFFDTRRYSIEVFNYPSRFRAAMIEGYGAKAGDIQIVVGLHGTAWPVGIDDSHWASLAIGAFTGIVDDATGAPATRNPLRATPAGGGANSVESAQRDGVTILLCNNTLRRMSRELATRNGTSADAVYAELRAGMLPGVIVVPAMIAAIGLAQERGASYLNAG